MEDVKYRNYVAVPCIVKENTRAQISICPQTGHQGFDPDVKYEITHIPMLDLGTRSSFVELTHPEYVVNEGRLLVSCLFEEEQEHSIIVDDITTGQRKRIGEFHVYSVAEDLFQRNPYKGDLHIHSDRSDGQEHPAYVAASCRKIGLDFMAVTDHGLYEPSLEAIDAFADVPIDLRIFPGEEVHPPGNPIHIINFGGTESVNQMFASQSYEAEVKSLQREYQDLPTNVNPYYFASSIWCFDKIKEAGGLSIFCHPYWVSRSRYHIPESLTTAMFHYHPFDAYELIGGYHEYEIESNMLQVLRYQEELAGGNDHPVVGVSDAHGCDNGTLFGWFYTIVFSPSLDLDDLANSIRDGYSVAVEALPGCAARAHGRFRLAKFAQFLIREVFPEHDRLCMEEGLAMIDHQSGNAAAKATLTAQQGQTMRYLKRCFPSP